MINTDLIKPITNDIAKLLEEKNKAYGSSVDMTYGIFGLNAYLVRMYDKVNRLTNLTNKGGEVNDESIEDTLRDLAGYSILALAQLQSEKKEVTCGEKQVAYRPVTKVVAEPCRELRRDEF